MDQNLFDYFGINTHKEVGLIFDVDELLFDNRKEITLAYRWLLESRGITVPQSELFPGKNLFDIIARIKEVYGLKEDIDALVLDRRQHYMELLSQADPTSVAPGVKELFCFVDQNRVRLNWRLGYASSSERAFVEIILKKIFSVCDLKQYVEDPDTFFYCNTQGDRACTCWEKGMEKKPSPMVYLKTLEKIGLPAGQCIAFEDSYSGMQAAIAAGLNVVVIPSPSQVATFNQLSPINSSANHYLRLNSLADLWPFFSAIVSLK